MKTAKEADGQLKFKEVKLTYNGEGIKLNAMAKPIYLDGLLERYTEFLPDKPKPKYVPGKWISIVYGILIVSIQNSNYMQNLLFHFYCYIYQFILTFSLKLTKNYF